MPLVMATKPHPNAEVLRALADGKKIQFWSALGEVRGWVTWSPYFIALNPIHSTEYKWRVAPPPPPPNIVFYAHISTERTKYSHSPRIRSIWEGPFPVSCTDKANVIFTVDGETGKLKAVELIK